MKININRLTYACVGIEITRRCNLNCAHCCRGDAQDYDMPYEVIDDFLDHTQAIYHLVFTGGEPTLNLDGLRYFLDSAKRHNVFISSLEMTTNGTVQNQELVAIIRDYNAYICQFVFPEYRGSFPIKIQISRDDFHNIDYDKAYQWYVDNISEYAQIAYNNNGRYVVKVGRAKELEYAIPQNEILKKIQIKTIDNKPLCVQKNLIPVFHENQVVVLCSLWVSANGYLHSRIYATWDEEDNDLEKMICPVRADSAQDIVDAIERYNKGKPFCIQKEDRQNKGTIDWFQNLIGIIDDKYSALKNHADQQIRENYVRQLVRSNIAGNQLVKSVYLGIVAGYLGVNMQKIISEVNEANAEYYSNNSELNKSNFLLLKQANEKMLSTHETNEMSELAYDIYNRELYGNHWDRMKKFQFDNDFQKSKHNRILSDIDFANEMLSIKPDSDYYKDRLARSEKELEVFEANLLLND